MTKTAWLGAGFAAGLVLGAVFGLGYSAKSTSLPQAAPPDRALVPAAPAAGPLYEILGDDAAFSRAARLATLLSELGPEAVPTVRTALEKPPPGGYGAVENVLMARFWATHDPAAAARWAFDSWEGNRLAVSIPVTEIFARADPQAALEAIQIKTVLGGPGSESFQRALVRGWYESGHPGLLDYIRGLGYGIQRQRALSVLARETIRHEGTDTLIRWAESLSEGEWGPPPDDDNRFKLEAFRQVTSELAMADPAAAVAWCDVHCDGPFASTLRELLAQRWAAQDGQAAMQWIATAPSGKAKDWAVQSAAVGWWRHDRQGLTDYVAKMAETGIEPWFQPALSKFASWTGVQAGEQAKRDGIRWAALIENGVEREKVLMNIARAWRRQDESAADAWLDLSPLSDDARTRVRTGPQPKVPGSKQAADSGPPTGDPIKAP